MITFRTTMGDISIELDFDKAPISAANFLTYAKDHFIMLQADFPRRKKNALSPELQAHNNALAERYNKGGVFPFVVVLNKDGRVLGQTSYSKKTPQEYIVELEGFIK